VKKIKKGIMIFGPPPTKGTYTIHNTPSDHRALANDMAALRRIGLTHLLDKKPLTMVAGEGYGPHILNAVTPRVMARGREVLFSRGWPLEATTSMLSGVMALPTAEKVLYRLGYSHHTEGKTYGSSRAKVWVADEEITRLHEEVKSHPQPADAFDSGPIPDVEVKLREPVPLEEQEFHCEICDSDTHDALGHSYVDDHQGEEPAPIPTVDFIDERDSWVVDPEVLLGEHLHRRVKERLDVLGAVGIEYEIRVWRKKEA
jgi:hypothetical protein